jgi:hypothetical protein
LLQQGSDRIQTASGVERGGVVRFGGRSGRSAGAFAHGATFEVAKLGQNVWAIIVVVPQRALSASLS